MTVTVGVDSYVDELQLQAYADARGIALTGDLSVLLINSMDYIESQSYKGYKTDETQPLEWPRTGVYVDRRYLDPTVVPADIEKAQMQGAVEISNGGDLNASIQPRVTEETIVGAVSVKYSDKGNQTTIYTKVDTLLSKYKDSSPINFSVVRA